MGQQQLLLIVLGIIIIGIAVIIGITVFHSYSVDSKRNNVINEGINLATMAQQYYMRPTSLGGGDKKFTGWNIPGELDTTSNGTFTAAVNPDNVVITAIGSELVTSNTPVEVTITVRPGNYQITVVH